MADTSSTESRKRGLGTPAITVIYMNADDIDQKVEVRVPRTARNSSCKNNCDMYSFVFLALTYDGTRPVCNILVFLDNSPMHV